MIWNHWRWRRWKNGVGVGGIQSSKPDQIQTEICIVVLHFYKIDFYWISANDWANAFCQFRTLQQKPQQTMCVNVFFLSPKLISMILFWGDEMDDCEDEWINECECAVWQWMMIWWMNGYNEFDFMIQNVNNRKQSKRHGVQRWSNEMQWCNIMKRIESKLKHHIMLQLFASD